MKPKTCRLKILIPGAGPGAPHRHRGRSSLHLLRAIQATVVGNCLDARPGIERNRDGIAGGLGRDIAHTAAWPSALLCQLLCLLPETGLSTTAARPGCSPANDNDVLRNRSGHVVFPAARYRSTKQAKAGKQHGVGFGLRNRGSEADLADKGPGIGSLLKFDGM